jgi:hypothetical protein
MSDATETCFKDALPHFTEETIFILDPLHIFLFSGVGLSPLGTAATSGLLYKPQMINEGDCGATGGMKIGRGNRSTRRKPAPAPLCPPQITHDQTRAWTWAAAVGSQWLSAWAMAQPIVHLTPILNNRSYRNKKKLKHKLIKRQINAHL